MLMPSPYEIHQRKKPDPPEVAHISELEVVLLGLESEVPERLDEPYDEEN